MCLTWNRLTEPISYHENLYHKFSKNCVFDLNSAHRDPFLSRYPVHCKLRNGHVFDLKSAHRAYFLS